MLIRVTVRRHQLRHVFVAGADQHRVASFFGLQRQRTDNVVRLNAGRHQQRQAHRLDHVMQRLDLRTQIVRHRWPVRFVFGEEIIAEGLPFGIKHHGNVARLILQQQAAQHIQHAVHRAGRLTRRVGQRREGVISAVEVGGTVNQD